MVELEKLRRLLDAVDLTLKRAARCDGDDRLRLLNTANEDAFSAMEFWKDGRVTGLEMARMAVEEAVARLYSSRDTFRTEQHRAELMNQAHIKVVAALREVENSQARGLDKEVAHAGH